MLTEVQWEAQDVMDHVALDVHHFFGGSEEGYLLIDESSFVKKANTRSVSLAGGVVDWKRLVTARGRCFCCVLAWPSNHPD